MSTSEKIAHAYGVLVARGDKVTVRAVQKQAGVRIGEVAAWMREHAAGVLHGPFNLPARRAAGFDEDELEGQLAASDAR